jgi:predicted RNase H-like HicB family nuclease
MPHKEHTKVKYPIAIEPGSDTQAWGVVVPDLPGCFSAADEGIDQAIENAKEAIELWIETAIDSGDPIPPATSIANHQANPEFANWIWAIADVDPAVLDETVERVNITIPRRILKRLDDRARAAGESRSSYIAHLAMTA